MTNTLKGMDAQLKEPARAGEKVDVVPVAVRELSGAESGSWWVIWSARRALRGSH